MKKNLLGLCAIVVAIGLFAFTTPRFATIYFVYKAGNPVPEKLMSNYTFTSTSPGTIAGISKQAWFIASVVNPASPTLAEFNTAFEAVDGNYGGADNDLLSDETTEDHTAFEKRNP